MEENTKKTKEPTVEELKKQLFEIQQNNINIIQEANKRISDLNYQNAFHQQQFMLEIVKQSDTFNAFGREDIVTKAMSLIDDFWFHEKEESEAIKDNKSV